MFKNSWIYHKVLLEKTLVLILTIATSRMEKPTNSFCLNLVSLHSQWRSTIEQTFISLKIVSLRFEGELVDIAH